MAEIAFPEIRASGVQTFHTKPVNVTDVTSLLTIPSFNECQRMNKCLSTGSYYAISSSLGTIHKAGAENLLKVHYLKKIASSVNSEKAWLNKSLKPPNENSVLQLNLAKFEELIFNSPEGNFVTGKSVLPSDLATLTCDRWLNMAVIHQFADMFNNQCKETKTFILNDLMQWKHQDLELFAKEKIGSKCKQLTFIVNVGTQSGSTFVATPRQPGNHWTAIYIDTVQNKQLYIDSLGLSTPKGLSSIVNPMLDAFSAAGLFPRKPVVVMLCTNPTSLQMAYISVRTLVLRTFHSRVVQVFVE